MATWNCDRCGFLTSIDPCYRCGKKREASADPKENLRRLMQGEATGVEEPEGGIAAIFGKWPGDETDEQIDEALYGDKRRVEAEWHAVERVVAWARDYRAGNATSHEVLCELLDALDAIRKKSR